MQEVKLYIEDNGNKQFDTVAELIRLLNEEREWFISEGREEEFLNSKIDLQLCDIEGQIVCGRTTCVVGSVVDGNFVITGNVDEVGFIVEK
jgi:hypothetical protein